MPRTVTRGHKDLLHDAVGRLFIGEGYDGLDLSGLSGGVPDWLFAKGIHLAFLVEVKTEASRRPGRHDERGLNERQQGFHRAWKSPIYIVASLEEAWRIVDQHAAAAGA